MTLLWLDGFDNYGNGTTNYFTLNDAPITAVYAATSTDRLAQYAGRAGGGALYAYNSSLITTPPLTSCSTVVWGMAIRLTTPTFNGNPLMSFRTADSDGDVTGYNVLDLYLTSNQLRVYNGSAVIASSTENLFSANTWHYLEMKVYCHASLGTVNVRVDGNEVISSANLDTQFSASHDAYSTFMLRPESTTRYDDMYILDTTGNTCNDFLGSVFVRTLYPDGDASGNWTANSGTDEYAMCNSTTPNSTKFISTNTSGNQQLFTYQGTENCTVIGVQVNTESKLTGNKMMGVKVVSQNGSGGSVNASATLRPSIHTMQTNTDMFITDPDGNPWSLATLNDVRYGVQVT